MKVICRSITDRTAGNREAEAVGYGRRWSREGEEERSHKSQKRKGVREDRAALIADTQLCIGSMWEIRFLSFILILISLPRLPTTPLTPLPRHAVASLLAPPALAASIVG